MEKPFIDIQNRLTDKVKALRYIDEDWGQLDYWNPNPPVQWPCALIDCDDMSVSQAGRHTMVDAISIVIRVADIRLSNTSAQAPAYQKGKAYELFTTITEVVKALHGWTGTPELYGRLQRTGQRMIKRKDGVRLYEVTFSCVLYNITAQDKMVAVENYTPDIQLLSRNPNVVDTSDATAVDSDIEEGKTAYARGLKLIGTRRPDDPNVVDTSTGTATENDIEIGKTAFVKGLKVTGVRDIEAEKQQSYNQGAADIVASQATANITPTTVLVGSTGFAANNTRVDGTYDITRWQPDPLWWDIKAIIQADNTAGYVGKMIMLADDAWLQYELTGADAYRTSDGAFYVATAQTEKITHAWQPSAYKADNKGFGTKWVMRYYKTANIVNVTVGIGATQAFLNCYPIYVICKDGNITAANFLQNGYILQAYDHINCTYTGASAANMLGATNQLSLQSIPDTFNFAGTVTNFGNAFFSPIIKRFNANNINWAAITSLSSVMANMRALEVIDGVIDLGKGLAQGSLLTNANVAKTATFRNVKVNLSINASSVWTRETLLDLLQKGLVDLSGQTAQTLTLGYNLRSLSEEEQAIATGKNWILA